MYINVLEQHLKNARLYSVFDENPNCEASVELYINLFNIQKSIFSDGAKRKYVLSNILTELFFCSCVTAICCLIHIANYSY